MTARPLTDYPQPALAVDLAILTVDEGVVKVLLVRRPDAAEVGGEWALPGGFVHIDQTLEATVARVLRDKASVEKAHFEQLATFGALDRDPRGRVVSVTYLALVPAKALAALAPAPERLLARVEMPSAGGPLTVSGPDGALSLAFDHAIILGEVIKRLRGKLDYTAIGYALLPERFTLREVQEVHEAILGCHLAKPAFRRKILDRGLIRPTGLHETGGAFRPAELYERIAEQE
ncbi:NrtR DNA-binding winged helix domain-containing protein [Pleomorphomonas sp. JP5]|uniref:NUDIX hydrolase n=1 Tax=Pleomorphomonas sp. JP5 TaxID=2942998 RepID=UPI002043BE80|nr:NUDIX domain-containing protein [Pleomorphomonas sp. JP5]MCM5557269.1 NUDIX domain-containing protein [Pleomorphomonas sp. JP5]